MIKKQSFVTKGYVHYEKRLNNKGEFVSIPVSYKERYHSEAIAYALTKAYKGLRRAS